MTRPSGRPASLAAIPFFPVAPHLPLNLISPLNFVGFPVPSSNPPLFATSSRAPPTATNGVNLIATRERTWRTNPVRLFAFEPLRRAAEPCLLGLEPVKLNNTYFGPPPNRPSSSSCSRFGDQLPGRLNCAAQKTLANVPITFFATNPLVRRRGAPVRADEYPGDCRASCAGAINTTNLTLAE